MSGRSCSFLLSDVLPFNLPPVCILDVGALLEGAPVYLPLLEAPAASVYGFEPNPTARDQLRKHFGQQGVWLANVLGDGSQRQFYHTYYPGCASLFEPDPDIVQAFYGMGTDKHMNFSVESQTEVSTSRLDDLVDIPSVDLAKLDVQGAELMVMQNGMSKLGAALVIQS